MSVERINDSGGSRKTLFVTTLDQHSQNAIKRASQLLQEVTDVPVVNRRLFCQSIQPKIDVVLESRIFSDRRCEVIVDVKRNRALVATSLVRLGSFLRS